MSLPELEYQAIKPTVSTLHIYLQIIGHIKQERMPGTTDHEHLALFVSGRGLTTGLLPGGVEVQVDLMEERVRLVNTGGRVRVIELTGERPQSFHAAVREALEYLGSPSSLEDTDAAVDQEPEDYDSRSSRKVFTAWTAVHEALLRFRSGFSGHTGEIILDWTTMNLGLTLYSGNRATPPGETGEVPEEALSAEQFSCGFSLGDELEPEPFFYAWMHPAVPAIEGDLRPSGATWEQERQRAKLVYRAVAPRTDWPTAVGWFFESAYQEQAKVARWDLQGLQFQAQT